MIVAVAALPRLASGKSGSPDSCACDHLSDVELDPRAPAGPKIKRGNSMGCLDALVESDPTLEDKELRSTSSLTR